MSESPYSPSDGVFHNKHGQRVAAVRGRVCSFNPYAYGDACHFDPVRNQAVPRCVRLPNNCVDTPPAAGGG